MEGPSQLKIRWNNFPLTVSSSLEALRSNGDLVDTSLYCEGHHFLVCDSHSRPLLFLSIASWLVWFIGTSSCAVSHQQLLPSNFQGGFISQRGSGSQRHQPSRHWCHSHLCLLGRSVTFRTSAGIFSKNSWNIAGNDFLVECLKET